MLTVNTVVGGRYQIVKLLGGGGMKQVYLAMDLRLAKRRCALAEMLDNFADPTLQRKAVAAFKREAEMLATLDNPHIPRIYDNFSELNRHYLVMEYVPGTTLEKELARCGGRLEEKAVIDLGLQIADALKYLHGLRPPVVYRDLKPSNVIITSAGLVKLIDFGIARYFQPLKTGTAIGTQGYAAPEQYRGKAEVRSDLYALAATMHHLLTGRDPAMEPPFSFPPLEQLRPDCDAALAKLINQALAYRAEDRPASAAEFRRRLMSAKAKVSPRAASPTAITRPVTAKRRPARFAWMAHAFGLAAVTAASLLLQPNPAHRSKTGSPTPAAEESAPPAEATPIGGASVGSPASAEELEAEARANPDDVGTWLRAARAWYRRAQVDEAYYPQALYAYQHVLELAPYNLEALCEVGNIDFQRKQYGKAVLVYKRYFAQGGNDPAVRLKLAKAYVEVGEGSRAIPQCQKVLATNPGSFRAELILALAYSSTGNYSAARVALQKAAKLASDDQESGLVIELSAKIDERMLALKARAAAAMTEPSRGAGAMGEESVMSADEFFKSLSPPEAEPPESRESEPRLRYFTIGSSKERVLALQGTPSRVLDLVFTEEWDYGPFGCSVQFRDNRVDSYDNSCGLLHVQMK